MPIRMFNGDPDGHTFTCKECKQEFTVIFQCNRCFEPVCIYCGKLRPEGSARFLSLVDNVNQTRLVDPLTEMGLNEWFEEAQESGEKEDFFCDPCLVIIQRAVD